MVLQDYSEEYITHLKKYLTITEDMIKLDDEVGEYLSSVGYNNSSTFMFMNTNLLYAIYEECQMTEQPLNCADIEYLSPHPKP